MIVIIQVFACYKICGYSISNPVEMIFNQVLIPCSFSLEWKKSNIVPSHNREKRQAKSKKLLSSLSAPYLKIDFRKT